MPLEQVAGTIMPVFGIVLLGYVMARIGVFRELAVDGVAQYVFAVAIPLLLFRTTAGAPIPADVPWDFLFTYYGGALIAFLLAMLLSGAVFKGGLAEMGILGGNLGQPTFFIVGLHGVAMAVLAGLVAGIAGLSLSGLLGGLWDALARQIMNPLPIALVAGLLHHHLALPMPRIADVVIGEFAQALVAVALFGFGGLVARQQPGGRRVDTELDRGDQQRRP